MLKKHKASLLFFTALGYSSLEAAYFGWNWFPQSPAEAIADGIAMLLPAAWIKEL